MSARIESAAELDALPVGSVVLDAFAAVCLRIREHRGHYGWLRATPAVNEGVPRHGRPYLPGDVIYHPDRDLLAEAEARGVERGRREALTEAADAVHAARSAYLDSPTLDPAWKSGWHSATDHHAHTIRARAGETPGGAA